MSIRTQTIHGLIFAACAWCVSGCEEEKNTAQAATKNPHPAASLSAQKATRPEPPPAPEPKRECPDGTMAEGTFNKPCEGKGATRMMEVTYKKTTDEGPQFRVISKSKQVILYGRIAVYFYDKAGKQMETKDESGKSKPYHTCFGKNLFAGVVKPSEKLFLNFSCVKKQDV
ncbi:MAG TPA: hypothetical protein VGJ84_14395, partial [Polyangiaceae bacterium]